MVFRNEKKGKLAVIPKKKGELQVRRPYELWTDMDRLFDQFRSNFDELFLSPETSLITSSEYRTPLMDVVDLGDKYEMHVEMPGIKKEDVNIEVTPKMVEIYAEHEETSENKGKNWLRQERSSTDFYRSLEFPEDLKTDNAEAELRDGILKLSLPKAEPKPRHETKKVKIK